MSIISYINEITPKDIYGAILGCIVFLLFWFCVRNKLDWLVEKITTRWF